MTGMAPMDILLVGLMGLCFLTESFFSGSEIALVSANRLKLQTEASEGSRSAALALRMLERPGHTLGMCLIGTNVSTITAATVGAILVGKYFDAPEFLAALFVVPFTLTLGEMVPKTLYQYHADRVVHVIVFPLHAVATAFTPVLWALSRITRLLGGDQAERPGVTREEIRLLLGTSQGTQIRPEDRHLIERVFDFSEAVVEETMVPLIEVKAVSIKVSAAEAAKRMTETGHSRLPVYRDRIDDIVGILLHHDLLAAEDWSVPVTELMRPPLFIPESKPIDALLRELRRERQRLAVVVDEYGGAVGIITVEDLLEEIVGEIEDESDKARPMVRRTGEREWRAEGRSEREHLSEACGMELPEGDFETLAGYILAELGRVPKPGEQISTGQWSLRVSKATDRAILEVVLRRLA